MNKNILFAFIFFTLFACTSKSLVVPEGILNETEMSAILTDLHVAQSSLNDKVATDKPGGSRDEYLDLILKNHHTTREIFLKSLKFYSGNPEILNEIYDSVMLKLNATQQ